MYRPYIYLLLSMLVLSACSHSDYLFKTSSDDISRSPSSIFSEKKPSIPPASINIGVSSTSSPCTSLRYSMKQETMRVDFMRCNVVLNSKVTPEAKFAVKEADLCFALSEFKDNSEQSRTHTELA